MKHFYSLIALTFILSFGAKAQNPIEITDDLVELGNGSVPGYSVRIPEADFETAKKEWIKYLESGTRSKVDQNRDMISIFGARVKPVSDSPVNVYSKIMKEDGAVMLQSAFETEKDKYLGKDEYANARKYLFDFAQDQYIDVVNEQISAEKKILRDLESDLNALERDREKIEKSDDSNQETIETERQRLADLREELASLDEGTYQGESVSGMGAPTPDDLKDMEKNRKKLNKEIRSAEKDIEDAQQEMRSNDRELPDVMNKQDEARRKVEEQQAVVQKLEEKLNNIKEYR